jgi:hypothetical protein
MALSDTKEAFMSSASNRICKTLPTPLNVLRLRRSDPARGAALRAALWPEGTRVLRVHFMEGEAGLRSRVMRAAGLWLRKNGGPANLDFLVVPGAGDSDIRVTFEQGAGSWSYTGTECKHPDLAGKPTMNYGWLDASSSEDDIRSVVLHEFGHALGLVHEHQNPKEGIQWNRDAVVRDLSGPPNNWDPETIMGNVLSSYDPAEVIATEVDPDSIMMYPVPAAWTDGTFEAGENTQLSARDIELVRALYP